MPVLNDAKPLCRLLGDLQMMRALGWEVVIVDGGSKPDIEPIARKFGARLVQTSAGRARQMNAGAQQAQGRMLWFVHADSRISQAVVRTMAVVPGGRTWGFFPVHFAGNVPGMKMVAWFMNQRSRLTRIATGDQGLFVARTLFQAVGGFTDVPLMEDVKICQRLRKNRSPHVPAAPITADPRRWRQHGLWPTIRLMWRLRYLHWRGVSPERLARLYRGQSGLDHGDES